MSQELETSGASNWSLVVRLLGVAWRYRLGCTRVILVQLTMLLLALSGVGFTGLGIDILRHAVDPKTGAPHWPLKISPPAAWSPMHLIAFVGCLVFAFAFLRGFLNFLNTIWLNKLVQGQIVVDLRAQVYDKLQRLSFRFFDANASSSLINRVTGDVQGVRMFVDQVIIPVLILITSLAAYAIYMINIHPTLTLVCLAPTPLLWMTSAGFSRAVQPAYVKSRELMDNMVQRLVENIRCIRVVKAFAQEQHEIDKFKKASQIVRDQQQWLFWRVSIFSPLIGFWSQLPVIILLGYGGWLVVNGRISIGTGLVSFAAILQQFSGQIGNISGIANSMQQALRGANRVFEVLDAPLEIESPADALPLKEPLGHVRFDGVWFDHGHDPVLQDIDFEVQPGEVVAIVGPTGSGKSALVSLIPRFYDPTGGRVMIDGYNLRDLELDSLRRSIGLVFQESFLFSTTVAANIAFGHPDASRAQIEKAARIAAAHDFIMELPNGYDTILGESGSGLSGGQRQRLAIARAVLLEPAILLLDDPTASVDPGTENEIIEAMDSAMAGRTTFLVANRPAVLRRADKVIVLERGRIAQVGSHDELMRQRGYYRRAVEQQMKVAP